MFLSSIAYLVSRYTSSSANPTGDMYVITDNLSSHNSAETVPGWLSIHVSSMCSFPRGQARLNLQEGWWRLLHRDAFAGQSFATADEIEQATRVATVQLNHRAKPWIWGRPPKTRRHLHHFFCYRF